MKRIIPWWVRIIVKVVLSRMPIHYSFFANVGLFRHGKMDNPMYAIEVFNKHYERADFSKKKKGFVALEVGPGDSLVSAILANAYGASKCYMVDAGNFAIDDIGFYRRVIRKLKCYGLDVKGVDGFLSVEELLERVGGVYLTNGLESLRSIPDHSVDFIWSQAVLEHIRLGEFDETMNELQRVLRPNGAASHRVDLKDHLGGALNNLRVSSRIWESNWLAKSGFYTNRIRYSDMINRFEGAGFDVDVINLDYWPYIPTPRRRIQKEFIHLSDDELRINGFDVLLRKDINKTIL